MKENPTSDFYTFFQFVYDFYNEKLYNNELPNCMFIVTRKKNTFGYFIPERWQNNQKTKSDEIAINPLMFGQYQLPEILKTVVHEMCHLWQYHLGTPSRKTYHNQEWGDKMESIGLMPSNTGEPGGKKTGQQMMEYVIEKGLFHIETINLINQDIFKKLWFDRGGSGVEVFIEELEEQINPNFGTERVILNTSRQIPIAPSIFSEGPATISQNYSSPDKLKIKYSCPICEFNVWGKPGLNIRCNECKSDYEEQKRE